MEQTELYRKHSCTKPWTQVLCGVIPLSPLLMCLKASRSRCR